MVDNAIDVGDVDLAVTVHVGNITLVIIGHATMTAGAATTIDDDDNHCVSIGYSDFTIAVHVIRVIDVKTDDILETSPTLMGTVVAD